MHDVQTTADSLRPVRVHACSLSAHDQCFSHYFDRQAISHKKRSL